MLTPDELHPVIQSLLVAHPDAISLEHCTRLAEIFDGDGNGMIEVDEFLYFCKGEWLGPVLGPLLGPV